MTKTRPSRRWPQLLAFGAMLAIAAGAVIAALYRPAGTPPTTPPASLQVAESVALARPPAATAKPASLSDTTPVARPIPPHASDLARLRERGFVIPVSGVSAAQLNDNYLQERAGGVAHEALDIMAPRGTPVVAVEEGRITKLFLSKPGGITLYQFDPSSTYAYYYAHLDGYADGIVEGGKLSKGQVIGYVGSSGNASPDAPHLHFAIFKLGAEKQWWRGTPINPFLVWRDARP